MRDTSRRRLSVPRGKRLTPTGNKRLADEVPHVYVTAENISLSPDMTIPTWLARKHRLVTRMMIAHRYKRSLSSVKNWTMAEGFPKPVALLDPEGKSMMCQLLYPAAEVAAWVKNHRPRLADR